MTHPSRNKGNKYERELVNQARKVGIPAERAYGSNGRALGHGENVDCDIGGWRVQAKRLDRRPLQQTLIPQEGVDVVATRANKGESYVIMRYTDFLNLIRDLK